MRSSTISNFAVLASSLLVKEAFAGRFDVRKRDLYQVTDVVIVTEEVTVTQEGDGSYQTGVPVAVGTYTSEGVAVLVVETPAASSTPVESTTSSIAPAVLIQQTPTTTSTPEPVPTTTSVAYVAPPAPVTTQAPVAATTLATVVSSSAPVATNVASSGKRGIAYNVASLLSAFTGSSEVSWAYNWGSSTASIPSQFEYVPLLWGLGSDHTNNWASLATKAIAAGSKHLLAFNEPDLGSQSNIGFADAATGYKTFMQPFAGKAKLGSPAVTNGGGQMGLTWLSNFLGKCTDCTVDFICIHWYNGGDAAAFMAYIDKAYAAGGNRPLWITEFQASGSSAQQQAFLATVIPQLDASPKVERYSYFMASDGNLLSGTSLSALGQTFANLA